MPTPGKSLRSVCWKSKDNIECLAVLSDRICSVGAIDDGSSEQYCSNVVWMEKGKLWANKLYCERR